MKYFASPLSINQTVTRTAWVFLLAALAGCSQNTDRQTASAASEASPEGEYIETFESRIGKLVFDHDVPSRESQELLFDEMDFQRAVQAYIWATPVLNSMAYRRSRLT